MSDTTKASLTVLIVGAGPTGLTLACELARSGVSFRLIEASPGPRRSTDSIAMRGICGGMKTA